MRSVRLNYFPGNELSIYDMKSDSTVFEEGSGIPILINFRSSDVSEKNTQKKSALYPVSIEPDTLDSEGFARYAFVLHHCLSPCSVGLPLCDNMRCCSYGGQYVRVRDLTPSLLFVFF
jgi:hypothetical protein